MKLNDFNALIVTTLTALAVTATEKEQKYTDCNKASDEAEVLRLDLKETQTKIRYVTMLQRDDVAAKAASYVKDEAQFNELKRDSYMLEKYVLICKAIATKNKSVFNNDKALTDALAYLAANDFKTVKHHDELRKNLFSKSDASKCHATDRQASMICSLFERLNVAKRVKVDEKKATEFDVTSKFVKDVLGIYA